MRAVGRLRQWLAVGRCAECRVCESESVCVRVGGLAQRQGPGGEGVDIGLMLLSSTGNRARIDGAPGTSERRNNGIAAMRAPAYSGQPVALGGS
jgi:hypothetical protein